MATTDLFIQILGSSTIEDPFGFNNFAVGVTNLSADPVTGASVSVPVPAGVTATDWQVVGASTDANVTGPTAGPGALATTVDLGGSTFSSITFNFRVIPDLSVPGPLLLTATITPPVGTTDTNLANNTASFTIATPADLSVTVDDGTTIVTPGTSTTYTITVTNNGPFTVNSLTLTDTIPAALLNATFGSPSAGSYDSATGAWSGLSLAGGQSVSMTLTGTIDPNATGPITNTVTVSPPTGTTDPTPGNNSAQDIDTIPVATTLATTASPNVTLSNSSVTLSDSATLSGGSNPTGNIVFTLSGPGGFSFTETDTVNGDGTYNASLTLPTTGTVAGAYSWTAQYTPGDPNNLGSTASPEQTLVSSASPGLSQAPSGGGFPGSTLTDTVTLAGGYFPTGNIVFTLTGPGGFSYTQTDALSFGNGTYTAATTLPPSGTVAGTYVWNVSYNGDGNNNAAPPVPPEIVTVGGPQADLAVTVTDGKTIAVPGSSDTYTITVTNNGPSTAVGAALTDLFPADLTGITWTAVATGGSSVTAASGSGNINTSVTLLPGGTATFTAGGQISASATGSLTNSVTVTPPVGTTDPNTGNNTAADTDTLVLPTDLAVTITDGKTAAVPGTSDTYTITVTNNGPSAVSSFNLNDTIPGDLLNATFGTPSAGGYDAASGLWSGLSLASGESVSIALSGVIGIDTGTLSNTVTVSLPAGMTDTNPGNNDATDTDTLTLFSSPYPPPPTATSANMILRRVDGLYAIYDIGDNASLTAHPLAQVGADWQFAGLGGFQVGDTADMLLRSASTGGFELYDISNNNITGAAFLGTVGMDWQVTGFGNFSSRGETDMIPRNANNGGFEVYNIANNQLTGANFMGAVGLDWQFSGVGNFSGAGESDMLLRNANTGGLEAYDIANNQITGAAFIGAVGLDWQFSGVGNFSGVPGETDLLLRNSTTGALEVYDINNNQVTGAAALGTVGLEWQFAGVAPVRGAGTSDLVLRNVNTGAFEAYDIANNQIVGAASLGRAGLEWQPGGFAADPAPASTGGAGSTAQLVQAMAAFGGGSGAADGLNTAPLNADASQQTFLTQPHA